MGCTALHPAQTTNSYAAVHAEAAKGGLPIREYVLVRSPEGAALACIAPGRMLPLLKEFPHLGPQLIRGMNRAQYV